MRRTLRIFWNYVVPAVVIAFVGRYFWKILSNVDFSSPSLVFRPELLIAAGVLYLCAHTIWGRFSVTLLRNQGANVTVATGLRAYFISQFGKYVPGKVWVIFFRVKILGRRIGISRTAIGITATYEALTSMAAGAMVGMIFLPASAWESFIEAVESQGYKLPVRSVWLVLPFALAPIGLVGLNRFVNRVNRWRKGANAPQLPRVKLHYVLIGLIQNSLGWACLGLSLWLTLRGVSPLAPELTGRTFLNLMSINAIAYVFGFIMLAIPAGAGVRELALQVLLSIELATTMDSLDAIGLSAVVAVVLRVTWTTFELIAAGLLYRYSQKVPNPESVAAE